MNVKYFIPSQMLILLLGAASRIRMTKDNPGVTKSRMTKQLTLRFQHSLLDYCFSTQDCWFSVGLDKNTEWKYLEVEPRDRHFKKSSASKYKFKAFDSSNLSGPLFLPHSLIKLCEPHTDFPIFTPFLVLAHSYLNICQGSFQGQPLPCSL